MSPARNRKVDLDLARKLKSGAVAHVFLVALVLAATPLLQESPTPSLTVATSIVFLSALRFALSLAHSRFIPRHDDLWRALFTGLLTLVAFCWAGLAHLAFYAHPVPSTSSMVVLLVLAGLSAGANSGLSSRVGYARLFNGIVLGVPIVSLAQRTGRESVAVWVMMGIFLIYQWVQAGHNASEFERLVQREADLEASQQAALALERERQFAERSLQESDQRFRELADASADGVLVHDGEYVIESNEGFARILGYDREEIVNSSLLRYFPLETRISIRERIANSFEGPYDVRAVRRDGTLLVLEVQGRNCLYRGEAVRVASVRDVTARRKAEFELREATASLRRVIASSPTPILLLGRDGTVNLWNPAAERVFGWTSDEVLGRPLPFVPKEGQAESQALIERVRAGESIVGREIVRRRKNGSPVHVSLSSVPVRNEKGEIESIMAILLDITAAKENERALRAAREAAETSANSKHDFLAEVFREIQAPIDVILGSKDPLLRNAAMTIRSAIENGVDVSRIEAGTFELDDGDFVFREALDTVAAGLRENARERNIQFRVEADVAIPVRLRGDARRLGQIVTDLARNAIRSSSGGDVSVRAKRERIGDEGMTLIRFEIENTGDASKSSENQLPSILSQHLVEKMSGRIGAENRLGRGSVIWFTVCLKPARTDETILSEAS